METDHASVQTPILPESTGGLELLLRAKDRLRSDLVTTRPWKEMISQEGFNIPSTFNDSISRIKINLAYFRMNYTILVLLSLFLSLLWHPVSLLLFVLTMFLWLFFYFLRDEPLVILHRNIDDRVVLVVLSVFTILVLLLTHVTLNILISVSLCVVLVLVHAGLRKNEDLFVLNDNNEEEDLEQLPLAPASSLSS
ncbi:hypothetical protein C5167_031537 [Papaver somniferum]|uniref:PRA1 family protein n=1 Tax=Papaver somniferum TaxID=3469 RepID=A0A4Y7K7J2_PAPSO|nr:PRA1 family protein F2-like [Papaver somniferum]RZC68282.1 hypothetical protein C5167_031537 [Papaver somniferum]